MTTDNVLTIFRLGIEATEQERITRGTPPDTEWIRARCGLPIKYPDRHAEPPRPITTALPVVEKRVSKIEQVVCLGDIVSKFPVTSQNNQGRGRPRKDGEVSRTTLWRRMKGL